MSSVEPKVPGVSEFEASVVALVRSLGLLQSDQTPCGQPLHVSQAHALREIAANPGISQQGLATELGLARTTVSELVTALVARGWVERCRVDSDRRLRCLKLTAAGESVERDVSASRRALLGDIYASVEESERAAFVAVLQKLSEAARGARTAIR